MRTGLLALLLIAPAAAADPTIDEQIAQLKAAEKAKADAEKAIAEIKASLRTALAEIQKKLADAGVIGPGPLPPTPPDPPTDQLVADLRAAFLADKGKPADLQALAALYTLMVEECGKAEYLTAAAVNAVYVDARDRMLRGALPGVRARCGREVVAVIGADPDAPLTDGKRGELKAVYARLARAVAEAGKP